MSTVKPHITVCICTFKRPALLQRLLLALERQRTDGQLSFSIVVTDNDPAQSARSTVEAFATRSVTSTVYSSEPRTNIALARNEAVRHARGDYVAFIDDDEFPDVAWLLTMLRACADLQAAGVLGPVRPHFDEPPPHWIVKGAFCERAEYPTGRLMNWRECRTGNVLFDRSILKANEAPFDQAFATGGEDLDFFCRMTAQGHEFRWCNEGVVFETVPPERWTRSYMFNRALLRGRNTLKLGSAGRRFGLVLKSLVAVPVYSLILPFSLLAGHHVFMRYGIRFCDHAGRLLSVVRLNPVNSR